MNSRLTCTFTVSEGDLNSCHECVLSMASGALEGAPRRSDGMSVYSSAVPGGQQRPLV
jgi:hypothetical protein